jgi:hypothetical protein
MKKRQPVSPDLSPLEGPDNSNSNSPPEPAQTIETRISNKFNADLFLYSGQISAAYCDAFCKLLSKDKNRENLVMILCTLGGDINSAYRMVRHIQRLYPKFTLYCLGICKSAGTLIALGADAIRMSQLAELGPLDVQIPKPDEFYKRTSGLDMIVAVQQLGAEAHRRFESSFLALKNNSGDVITTRTAAQIASEMVVGLFSPISGQIDPLRLAENSRQLDIARAYGKRLNVDETILTHLIEGYPSHDFVIDFDEAQGLFPDVQLLDEDDVAFEKALIEKVTADYNQNVIRFPPMDNKPRFGQIVPAGKTSPEASETDRYSDNSVGNRAKIGLTTEPWNPSAVAS